MKKSIFFAVLFLVTTATVWAQGTIALDGNGASTAGTESVTVSATDANIGTFTAPGKTNAMFAGYATNDGYLVINISGAFIPSVADYTDASGHWIGGDKTVYARWNNHGVSIEIDENDALTATITATPASVCSGTTSNLAVAVEGGTRTYTYAWSAVSANAGLPTDLTGAAIDVTPEVTSTETITYTVKATDGNGCEIPQTVELVVNELPTFIVAGTDPLCNSNSTTGSIVGSIAVDFTAGAAPYDLTWTDGSATNVDDDPYTIANLPAGTYEIAVTDDNGCVAAATQSVTLNNPAELEAGEIAANQFVCYNSTPAVFTNTIPASNNVDDVNYHWEISIDGTEFTDIDLADAITYQAGNLTQDTWYRRVATDACFVKETEALKVIVNPELKFSQTSSNVLCNGGNTGEIILSGFTPGTASDYTIKWTPEVEGSAYDATTGTITGLTNGTYTIYVTQTSTGCAAVEGEVAP